MGCGRWLGVSLYHHRVRGLAPIRGIDSNLILSHKIVGMQSASGSPALLIGDGCQNPASIQKHGAGPGVGKNKSDGSALYWRTGLVRHLNDRFLRAAKLDIVDRTVSLDPYNLDLRVLGTGETQAK